MCNRRVDCVGPDWTIILAGRLRQGVQRRRALSRTIVGATAAVAACRAVVAGKRQALDVVTDAVGKRGRPALAAEFNALSSLLTAACLPRRLRLGAGVRVRAALTAWYAGASGFACHRPFQAVGLSPGGVAEMVSVVNAAFSVARLPEAPALRRPRSSHAPRSPTGRSLMSPRGVRPARDGPGFLEHAIRRARQGSAAAEQARQQFIEMNLHLVVSFAKRMHRPELGVSFPDLVQEGTSGS